MRLTSTNTLHPCSLVSRFAPTTSPHETGQSCSIKARGGCVEFRKQFDSRENYHIRRSLELKLSLTTVKRRDPSIKIRKPNNKY
jgi:hypothetical protein